MAPKNCDFCGWVTKNDTLCSDGRTIRRDAFAHQDGQKVPMVWMHNHSTPDAVVGYTILENRPEGVYGYSYCNNTENGRKIKELVQHGDINSYSIFANKLKEQAGNVLHGIIREVSVVLSGANDGARIEEVSLSHSAAEVDDYEYNGYYDAIIVTGDSEMSINHSSDDNTPTIGEVLDTMDESMLGVVNEAIGKALAHASEEEFDEFYSENEDILDSMDDDQIEALSMLIEEAYDQGFEDASSEHDDDDEDDDDEDYEEDDEDNEDYEDDDDEEFAVEHSAMSSDEFYGGENDMKRNVFDNESMPSEGGYLTHSDLINIVKTAKDTHAGSMKQVFQDYCDDLGLQHDADSDAGISRSTDRQNYGVNDPSFLFPEYKSLNNPPEWIRRDMDWVSVLMNAVHHTPFSRVKSQYANITADAARARGYIKGNKKVEEVFTLLKRVTTPQTIYKLQKFDRDDMIDITDFDVIAWIKGEMDFMLKEEIARAILIGDGRSTASNDHIGEDHIRPIWGDSDLFTIEKTVTGDTDAKFAKNMIEQSIRARKDYKGSGNPILFTTDDFLTEMLLLEDTIGHPLYKTEAELATKMRVSRIVTVPVMENVVKNSKQIVGIIVNPIDYNVGKDGKADGLFDDFDIDYNQYKYLKETRMSGALVKPYSAIALVKTVSSNSGSEETTGDNTEDNGEG